MIKQSRSQVDRFLEDLKNCLSSQTFDIDKDLYLSFRAKNQETLLALNYDRKDVVRVLMTLTVSDYYETLIDPSPHEEPPIWFVFGKVIKRMQINIKLKITDEDRKVVCISFHEAEFPMKIYPYR